MGHKCTLVCGTHKIENMHHTHTHTGTLTSRRVRAVLYSHIICATLYRDGHASAATGHTLRRLKTTITGTVYGQYVRPPSLPTQPLCRSKAAIRGKLNARLFDMANEYYALAGAGVGGVRGGVKSGFLWATVMAAEWHLY